MRYCFFSSLELWSGEGGNPRLQPIALTMLFPTEAIAMATKETAVEERKPSSAAIKPFEPKFMKVGVLTAALQELTPRDVRDPDPDRAIEDWLEFARQLGVKYVQLSSALHPSEADVPPEAMLDPVANTLDLRQPFDKARAKRVLAAVDATGVGFSDVGYFDNMLHHDPAIRKKKRDFMLRAFDAAALLGVD